MSTKYLVSAALFCLSLNACQNSNDTVSNPTIQTANEIEPLASYPLKSHFKCLPKTAAIIAAHRGTARGKALSENSKQGLLALIDHDTLIAEIDVAQTKDGVHFLYHDGVWDDDSTGRGAVAASLWNEAQTYLLNDTEGKLTSHNVVSLSDYLKVAKDNIYLEIDFKSSANYRKVINLIRAQDMQDQVILIAYKNKQAERLAQLAPNMLISMSVRDQTDLDAYEKSGIKRENIAAWTGRDGPSDTLTSILNDNNIPALTYPSRRKTRYLSDKADLIVSDYALDQKPIIGKYNKIAYEKCLNSQ